MTKIKILLLVAIAPLTNIIYGQMEKNISEIEQIRSVLMDYIDGTAEGEPERIKNAFHQDLNLYTVDADSLKVLSGKKYISYFENRKKRNRIGNIVSIDYENDAAMAKIRILMPARKRIYTDYLLLLKMEGKWKIIHKSYTYVNYPSEDE